MTLESLRIPEPLLEFGHGQRMEAPKDGLFLFGPLEGTEGRSQVRIGVVGTDSGAGLSRRWLERISVHIPGKTNRQGHPTTWAPDWPGFETTFEVAMPKHAMVEIGLTGTEIERCIKKSNRSDAVRSTVLLFAEAIRCIAALTAAEEAEDGLREERRSEADHAAALAAALLSVGEADAAGDLADVLGQAKGSLSRLETQTRAAEKLELQREALSAAGRDLAREEEQLRQGCARSGETTGALLGEAGIAVEVGLPGLTDAVAAFEAITTQAGARAGLARQVAGMERDIAIFEQDVSDLFLSLGRRAEGRPTEAVRSLMGELRDASSAQVEVARLRTLLAESEEALRETDARWRISDAIIAETMRLAKVAAFDELRSAMAASDRVGALRSTRSDLVDDLAALGDGLPLDELSAKLRASTRT